MKKILLSIYTLSSTILVFGQTISSQIIDSKSQAPIQYVNIGIIGKNIGTVSDSLGNFHLSLQNTLNTDSLRISIIGYSVRTFKIGEIRTNFPEVLFLNKKVIQLKEIFIDNDNSSIIELGLKKKHSYPIPLFKGAEAKVPFPQKNYRHEIGTRFYNSKTIKLDSIKLNFAECNVERLSLRLNVYSIKNDNILENILEQPLYITLDKKEALNFPVINISDQYLEVDSDFLISIENYKNFDDNTLYLFANFKKKGESYPTYYRHSTQSNWIRLNYKKSKPIGLSILAYAH